MISTENVDKGFGRGNTQVQQRRVRVRRAVVSSCIEGLMLNASSGSLSPKIEVVLSVSSDRVPFIAKELLQVQGQFQQCEFAMQYAEG